MPVRRPGKRPAERHSVRRNARQADEGEREEYAEPRRPDERDEEPDRIPDEVRPEECAAPQRGIEERREVEPAEVLGVAQAPLVIHDRVGRDRFPPDRPDDAEAERRIQDQLHPLRPARETNNHPDQEHQGEHQHEAEQTGFWRGRHEGTPRTVRARRSRAASSPARAGIRGSAGESERVGRQDGTGARRRKIPASYERPEPEGPAAASPAPRPRRRAAAGN